MAATASILAAGKEKITKLQLAWDVVGKPDLCRTLYGGCHLTEWNYPTKNWLQQWLRSLGPFFLHPHQGPCIPCRCCCWPPPCQGNLVEPPLHYIQVYLFDWGYLTYQMATHRHLSWITDLKKSLIVNCASWTNKSEVNFVHFQNPNTKPEAQTEVNVSGVKRLLRVQLWRMWRHRQQLRELFWMHGHLCKMVQCNEKINPTFTQVMPYSVAYSGSQTH